MMPSLAGRLLFVAALRAFVSCKQTPLGRGEEIRDELASEPLIVAIGVKVVGRQYATLLVGAGPAAAAGSSS